MSGGGVILCCFDHTTAAAAIISFYFENILNIQIFFPSKISSYSYIGSMAPRSSITEYQERMNFDTYTN